MTAHMKMDAPDRRNRLDSMAQGVIGEPLDRSEGALKVSGKALYAHEWQVEGLCHAVLVRSAISRGRVTRIDKAAVEAMDGVLAVIDDERLLRNPAQKRLAWADLLSLQDRIERLGAASRNG